MKVDYDVIPALTDNYIWAIRCKNSSTQAKRWAIVDPGEAAPVLKWAATNQYNVSHVLVTHHHHDHTGGIPELIQHWPHLKVIANTVLPAPWITKKVTEGHYKNLIPGIDFNVMQVPGHTLDHIVFFNEHYLFCGDTLFSLGCGRVFEGTMQQMYQSLQKIAQLNPELLVFPGHEYTHDNAQFACSLTPQDQDLLNHCAKIAALRSQHQITLPSRLSDELQFNPFLKTNDLRFLSQLPNSFPQTTGVEMFGYLRQLKDNFCS